MKIISKDRYDALEAELRQTETAIEKTNSEYQLWKDSLPKTAPSREEYLERSRVVEGYKHCHKQLVDMCSFLADEMNEMAAYHHLAKSIQENDPKRALA